MEIPGTTASVVSAMSACLKGDAVIDGDSSLRRRTSVGLCDTLSQLGCEISSNSVPRTVSGRISSKDATIDLRNKSGFDCHGPGIAQFTT